MSNIDITNIIKLCKIKENEKALELIKTESSRLEQNNEACFTALILACNWGLNQVAHELIKTKQSE